MATRFGGGGRGSSLATAWLAWAAGLTFAAACSADDPPAPIASGGFKTGGGGTAGANGAGSGSILPSAGAASGGSTGGLGGSPAAGDGGGAGEGGAGAGSPLGGAGGAPEGGVGGDSTPGGAGASGAPEGGAGGDGPSQPLSVCDGATRVLPLAEGYIDNFETTVRLGSWYGFSDTVPPGLPGFERLADGASSTGYAGHHEASDIRLIADQGYGAGLGFLLQSPAQCLDVSAFDGISFWAKGVSGSANVVELQLVTPATQPSDAEPRGDCAPAAACAFEHPSAPIALTSGWKQHVVPFSALTSVAASFTGKVFAFNVVTPDTSWEMWIDEVTFYKGTAPTGPVSAP